MLETQYIFIITIIILVALMLLFLCIWIRTVARIKEKATFYNRSHFGRFLFLKKTVITNQKIMVYILSIITVILVLFLLLMILQLDGVNEPDVTEISKKMSYLEKVVQKNLIDKEILGDHTQEIIAAINQGKVSQSSGKDNSPSIIGWLTIIVFVGIVFVFSRFLLRKIDIAESKASVFGYIISVVTAIFGSEVLLTIDASLFKELNLFTVNTAPYIPQPTELHIMLDVTDKNIELDCGKDHEYTIGPFPDKDEAHKLESTEVTNQQINNIIEILTSKAYGRRLIGLVLIGSADKRLLNEGVLTSEYISNAGLARARAEWVRKEFESSLEALSIEGIIILHAVPSTIHLSQLEEDYKMSRAVQVCAFWR